MIILAQGRTVDMVSLTQGDLLLLGLIFTVLFFGSIIWVVRR